MSEAPTVVLLDALGTLVELEPPAPVLRAELERRFGVAVTLDEAQRAIAAEIAYYRAHLNDGRDEESLLALRRRCAEVLRGALPEAAAAAVPLGDDRLVEALLASLRFSAFAEVQDELAALRSRGLALVVVSNWDVSLHGVLDRVGLAPLLDGVVTSAEAGARKPAPAIFSQALRLVGALPRDAVHVGDSFEEDVVGARNAGIEPVLVVRDVGPAPPGVRTLAAPAGVRTIATLSELAPNLPLR